MSLLQWWIAIPSITEDTEWMVAARRYELDVRLPRQGTWGDFARTLPAPEPAPPPAPNTPYERP